MGGFGVLAWLAVGAVAGWTISRLMVTAGDDALRGTAAGMVGAILGGLGIPLLGTPAPDANSATALFAALAGSLWLTWITCVVTSGREHRSQPRAPIVSSLDMGGRAALASQVETVAAPTPAG